MVSATQLLRVFWPADLPPNAAAGSIIGWQNSAFDFFVVDVLFDVQTWKVASALQNGTLFKGSSYPLRELFEICGSDGIKVLGTVNSPPNDGQLHVIQPPSQSLPVVNLCWEAPLTTQIIIFHRPRPHQMQYLSLSPISLVLSDVGPVRSETALEKKLKLHTVKQHEVTAREQALPRIIAQINCAREIAELLARNAYQLRTRPKRSLSVGEKVVESATTVRNYVLRLLWRFLTEWIYPFILRIFFMGLICHRVIAEMVLRVLEWRPRPDSAALKDISATAQQLDIRLQQFCYWPYQYATLRKRKKGWESITDRHPDYIRFYNSLWLVANDVIIGIAVGSYIIDNADRVAERICEVLNTWTIEGLIRTIDWLMDWPAGLKLNTELASFLGGLVLFLLDYWRNLFNSIQPVLPMAIYLIGFASFAGATMPVAMFSDMLTILTVHISCFYTASARLFNWQLTIIMSLFHLFRGRKHNVLRNRIDSCNYDLDQLLLGTILFTLLFFLLPTIAVFYLTFTAARIGIISLMAAQDTLLACLNHFPLFALMLRVKDPQRLPGGICFELQDQAPDGVSVPCSFVLLKSVPLSLRAMFDQYFQLAHRIRKHYFSHLLVLCLVTGQFLPPIDRKSMYSLQYSMLPTQRASVCDLWAILTRALDVVAPA